MFNHQQSLWMPVTAMPYSDWWFPRFVPSIRCFRFLLTVQSKSVTALHQAKYSIPQWTVYHYDETCKRNEGRYNVRRHADRKRLCLHRPQCLLFLLLSDESFSDLMGVDPSIANRYWRRCIQYQWWKLFPYGFLIWFLPETIDISPPYFFRARGMVSSMECMIIVEFRLRFSGK